MTSRDILKEPGPKNERYLTNKDKRIALSVEEYLLYKHPSESIGQWEYIQYIPVRVKNWNMVGLGHSLTVSISFIRWKDKLRFLFTKKKYVDEEIENNLEFTKFTKRVQMYKDWLKHI